MHAALSSICNYIPLLQTSALLADVESITERWPGARKYRDVYESIKQMVLESIEENHYEPRRAITNLRPGLRAVLRAIDDNDEHGEFTASAMVSDMAGGSIPPDMETPQIQAPNCTANTPGTPGIYNLMLPMDGVSLDFQGPEGFVDTMFTTPSSDWMVA